MTHPSIPLLECRVAQPERQPESQLGERLAEGLRLELSLSPLAQLPALVGAHELAWSYLLDAVVADAYSVGLGLLRVSLPVAGLEDEVRLRVALSRRTEAANPAATGVALLSASQLPIDDAARLYRLSFGLLAPRELRTLPVPVTAPWKLAAELSVYCLPARLWGGAIRVAALLDRPDLGDRVMFKMRRLFVRWGRHPAYYHLGIWSRL